MAAMRIALDEGVPENNHAKLTDGQELVPAGDIIQLVHGDGAEPSSLEFLQRLKAAAGLVGVHTDAVRAAVQQNADALKATAAALQDSDAAGAADLSTTTAIIDQTAADTTTQDVQSAQQFLEQEAATAAATAAEEAEAVPAASSAPATQQERAASSDL